MKSIDNVNEKYKMTQKREDRKCIVTERTAIVLWLQSVLICFAFSLTLEFFSFREYGRTEWSLTCQLGQPLLRWDGRKDKKSARFSPDLSPDSFLLLQNDQGLLPPKRCGSQGNLVEAKDHSHGVLIEVHWLTEHLYSAPAVWLPGNHSARITPPPTNHCYINISVDSTVRQ